MGVEGADRSLDQREVRAAFAEQLSWPDDRLLDWASRVVSVPNAGPADSFALHAPLELMARAALLPLVRAEHRDHARERIAWLAAEYQGTDLLGADPGSTGDRLPEDGTTSVDDLLTELLQALEAADLPAVDSCTRVLAAALTADALRRALGPVVAPSLAAAAHGSIALNLLGRTPAVRRSVLRGALREIGRQAPATVATAGLAAGDRPLVDALLAAPMLEVTGPERIMPMVRAGAPAAAELLADVSSDPVQATRALSRVAAWSMLQDDPEHAPYGWTHTLTIPQAVMSIGLPPRDAVAIAGSQVVGFRASMGTRPLDPAAVVEPDHDTVQALATGASLHFDAHLVKYTLACFDAAAADPEMAGLYLAAASNLARWWSSQPDDGFFDRPSLDLARQP